MGIALRASTAHMPRTQPRTDAYQVVVLGAPNVGKSSFIERFIREYFQKQAQKPNVTYKERSTIHVQTKEGDQTLELWDSYGEDYVGLRDMCIKYCDGFIIMYSIDSEESFQQITKYKKLLGRIKERENFPTLLVGNKTDLNSERQVSLESAQNLALSISAGHLETSVVHNCNIERGLMEVIHMIEEHRMQTPLVRRRRTMRIPPLIKSISSLRSLSWPSLRRRSQDKLELESIQLSPQWELPEEIWILIFQFLPHTALPTIMAVCQKWYRMAKDSTMKECYTRKRMLALHILSYESPSPSGKLYF